MSLYLNNYTIKLIVLSICLFASAFSFAQQDKREGEALYNENIELTKNINSLYLDCSQVTPICKERSAALASMRRFDELMKIIYQKQVDRWPNDEFYRVQDAYFLRKDADYDFTESFYGDAKSKYAEAADMLQSIITEGRNKVNELLEEGELYLYTNNKPDWAESYFMEALPYDPENQRIIKGISRIEFLLNFEDKKFEINLLIQSRDYTQARIDIENLLLGDPGNDELESLLAIVSLKLQEENLINGLDELVAEKDLLLEGEADLRELDDIALNINEKINNLKSINNDLYAKTSDQLYLDESTLNYYFNSLSEINKYISDKKIELVNQKIQFYKNAIINSDNDALRLLKTEINDYKSASNHSPEILLSLDNLINEIDVLLITSLSDSLSLAEISEDWQKSVEILEDINKIQSKDEIYQKIQNYLLIINLYSSINQYKQKPELLDNRKDITKSRNAVAKISSFIDDLPSSTILKKSIDDFQLAINDAEEKIIIEEKAAEEQQAKNINEQKNLAESKKQKESVIAKTEDNTNTKNQTQQTQSQTQANQNTIQKSVGTAKSKNNPSSKPPLNENKVNEKTITKKAKIKFSSFVSAVSCTGKYRNREFEPTWRVKVNANGRAESLEVLNIKSSNGKPMKMNSSDTKTLEIINKALLKSKYTPAKAGSTSVDSTTEVTFKVPSYFCE